MTFPLFNFMIRNALTLFLLIHVNHAQQLSQQGATPAIPPSTTPVNDITSYGGDVFVDANFANLYVYYENYLIAGSPTSSYSQASPLTIQGCPSAIPAPSPCDIGSVTAGQSLQTFDVLLGGVPNDAGYVVAWKDTRVDWSQQQVLVARDATSGDNFGFDVALDMNNPHVALIGAPNSDDAGVNSGSAYMFASSPTAKFWTEGQRLVGSTETAGCQFGRDVQVMGRQAIVAAPGCCKIFLYEQEKPKPVPPPPPAGCGSDDDNVSSSSFETLKDRFEASSIFRPFADIHQTRTLQWSEQQIFDYSASGWCTANNGAMGMTMSYDQGNLVLGFPYYNYNGYSDNGMVLSVNLETFKGDCDSSLIKNLLSFEELFEMKEAAHRDWELMYSGRHHDDSKCTHPPKPTPQCEVSRWSVQQTVVPVPALVECSYFGSNVAVCGDLLFVQAQNYETDPNHDWPDNCNQDIQSTYNDNFNDGALLIYERQSNGQWTWLQTLAPGPNAHQNYGDPLTCSGANAYFGQTGITQTPSPRPLLPTPGPGNFGDITYISYTGDTTVFQYVQDATWDCAIIMLGDHFGDGWNGADLVISGPGADQQRYTDSCDSITNPYYIRWCPVDNNQCGEVTMEIPGAAGIPFHPEIYWGVYLEDTGQWVYGDHATKLTFDWDCDNHDLSLTEGKHVLTDTTCDCDCQTTRPTPKPTPQEKPPPSPPSDPTVSPTTASPTTSPSSLPTVSPTTSPSSHRRKLISSPHDANVNDNDTHRQLKGDDDKTHRPTISPAPTLALQPYTADHWEWLTMTTAGNNWCTTYENVMRGTKYYIYDKSGTHLLQSGTACATSVQCWMVLPPNGDYIMRIGGALDADRGSYGATFCGYPLISPSHFEFSITSDQQCIPEEYYTRTQYCTNELHVKALVAGVLLIKDVFLASEGLSRFDQLVFQKAFDSLFGNIGVTSTVRAEDSSDGLLVSFTIGVPVVYYGYENTEFNGPHLTYLQAHDDLLNSFRADVFGAMLDNQVHYTLNLQQQHSDGVNDLGQCHFTSHGAISLLALKEEGWENEMPFAENIEPITFFPPDDDKMNESPFLYSFQTGIPTFLIVVLVGGTVLFLIHSQRKATSLKSSSLLKNSNSSSLSMDGSSSSSSSSTSASASSNGYFKQQIKYIYDFARVRSPTPSSSSLGAVDYQVIRTPSDDVEAHAERSSSDKKSQNRSMTKSKGTPSTAPTPASSYAASSATSTRFVPSANATTMASGANSRQKKQQELLEFEDGDEEEEYQEEEEEYEEEEDEDEIDEDVLSLIMQAGQQQQQQKKKSQQQSQRLDPSSRSSQKKSSVPPSRFTRSTKATEKVAPQSDQLDLDSLAKVLRNHR